MITKAKLIFKDGNQVGQIVGFKPKQALAKEIDLVL
jgi:hypothetical protein